MHLRISRYFPSRIALRPQSSRRMCIRSGPSGSPARFVPVTIDTYDEIAWPEALRGNRRKKVGRSAMRGMTFSIPTTARWTRGRTAPIRPFPSLVTRTSDPVSATRKFAPETPIPAERNFARRCLRAIPTSSGMLSVRGSPRGRPDGGGRLPGELDDELPEVGLDHRDARSLKRLVEGNLLGRHRFRLDGEGDSLVPRDPRGDLPRLRGVSRDVHDDSPLFRLLGEAAQVRVGLGLALPLD